VIITDVVLDKYELIPSTYWFPLFPKTLSLCQLVWQDELLRTIILHIF